MKLFKLTRVQAHKKAKRNTNQLKYHDSASGIITLY